MDNGDELQTITISLDNLKNPTFGHCARDTKRNHELDVIYLLKDMTNSFPTSELIRPKPFSPEGYLAYASSKLC